MFYLTSCSYIAENKDHNNKAETIERIEINKEEARLLVKASRISLEVIALSEKVLWYNFELSKLALNFEKDHNTIYTYFNEIAKEKLILIPSTVLSSQDENLSDYDDNNLTQNYIKTVTPLLKKQIDILEILYKSTLDIDFRVLVVKIKAKLKNQLNQLEG